MRIKSNTLYSACVFVILALAGFIFLKTLVLPYLRGENDLYVYGGDNYTFRVHSDENHDLLDLVHIGGEDKIAMGSGNLFGMALYALIIEQISHDNFHYVLLFLNLLILAGTMRNYRIVFESYQSPQYPIFLLFFLLNPLFVFNVTNLSKEIWGLFFVSAFLRYRISKAYFRFFLATFLSYLIRDVFAATAVLFFLMSTLRVNKLVYLIGISIVAPFIISQDMVDILVEGQDEKSLGISILLNNIQSYPFGYVLTYLPKLMLSAFANLHPLRLIRPASNVIGNFTTVSSFLSFIFSVRVCEKVFIQGKRLDPIFPSLFFSYTFFAALTSFIHYRYLFPLSPILPMMALLASSRADIRTADKLGSLGLQQAIS